MKILYMLLLMTLIKFHTNLELIQHEHNKRNSLLSIVCKIMKTYKYPSTSYLPWSQSKNDNVLTDFSFLSGNNIVITEKMDGENTTLYPNGFFHARSVDSVSDSTRHWMKAFWMTRYYNLPYGYRICGENLYNQHSIAYDNLPSYFLGFSLWYKDTCQSWDETEYWLNKLNIKSVPVIYKGKFDFNLFNNLNLDLTKSEGYVVRLADEFGINVFSNCIGKFVRLNHVQSDKHWKKNKLIKNKLIHNS